MIISLMYHGHRYKHCTTLVTLTHIVIVICHHHHYHQSCYQRLSLRGQGQDFFLKAKDMKIIQGQLCRLDYELKFALQ